MLEKGGCQQTITIETSNQSVIMTDYCPQRTAVEGSLPARTITVTLVDGMQFWRDDSPFRDVWDKVYEKKDFYLSLMRKNLEEGEAFRFPR